MQIPTIKHDKIQYMLIRLKKRGYGGEKVIGNLKDSTGQKM